MPQVLPILGPPFGPTSIVDGHVNDSVIDTIRRFLPPAYKNKPGWDALAAALAAGDEVVRKNVYDAFAQLFLSSASGNYLIQRASDQGVVYPDAAALTEDLFRELAILLSTERQIAKTLLGILEVFYGSDATRARIISTMPGPYALVVGDTLEFVVDGGPVVTVTIESKDFSNVGVGTTAEVAAVITRAFYESGSNAFAVAKTIDGVDSVVVYSGAVGLLGSVQVVGGFVNRALRFPTAIPWTDTYVGNQWTGSLVTIYEYKMLWTPTRAPGNLTEVNPGDWVTFDAAAAPFLRGWYQVIDVHIDADLVTGSYSNKTWFTFKPTSDFVSAPPIPFNIAAGEMIFFRPDRKTVLDNTSPSFLAQYDPASGADIILPATTQAVGRAADAAAYLHDTTTYDVLEVWRTFNGVYLITLTGTIPFSDGDYIELRGSRGNLNVLPAPTNFFDGATGGWHQFGKVYLTLPQPWWMVPMVIPPNSFFIVVDDLDYHVGHGIGGTVQAMAAPVDSGYGSYSYEPNSGFAVTAVETTTTVALAAARGISTLQVTSTTGFTNGESWLVIGFGTEFESGPIRCLGVIDGTNLAIDRSFVIPKEIPVGTSVILLASKGAFVPPENAKAFIITDSAAGRVAAEGFIDDTKAAGVNVNKIIVYPGDRGLGGEADPITGIQLSDKVAVWASDDVDAAIKAAHDA